jgi:hypothetical protein
MRENILHFIERTTFFGALSRSRKHRRLRKEYDDWKRQGSILPMPTLGKQRVVSEYIERYHLPILVETGTYTGHMVYGMLHKCKEIYSIELDKALHEKAKQRFVGYQHVHLLQGNSSILLPQLIRTISSPCLFWLDAHYSGGRTAKGDLETPIIQELPCILQHPCANEHVILIDDARCFTGNNDYPRLGTLKDYILRLHPDWMFEVRDDIIRTYNEKEFGSAAK